MTSRLAPLAAILVAACAVPAATAATATNVPIPPGNGQQTAVLDGVPIQVFTYQPTSCTLTGVLLVFHGLNRNAGTYRDDAVPLGQHYCMLVVAPLFDTERFPTWRYQRGGIAHGAVQPEASWTVNFVPRLADWARAQEHRPDLPYSLIGHSAGGQFLSRVAAFGQGGVTHIVIANPSTWVEPSLDVAAPYGFGGAYPPAQAEAALRRYLAQPVTILLGGNDTGSANLAENDEAEAQGGTRLARGQNAFHAAEQTASQHNWPFNWRLAIVPGVGHNARAMLASTAAFEALRP